VSRIIDYDKNKPEEEGLYYHMYNYLVVR